MKFLYLLPFLLPQVASACVGSIGRDVVGLVILSTILIVGISLAFSCLVLLVYTLLPRNKKLPIVDIFNQAKKSLIAVVVGVTVATGATLGLHYYQTQPYTDRSGTAWYPAC